jgi:dihydropteroate synthase
MATFLPFGTRTFVMGILNRTPNSFSDGGRFDSLDAALAHAEQLAEAGSDLIDIGGESTNPTAALVSIEEEKQRVLPVIEHLAKRLSIPISVDTYKADVARSAIDAGARLINDVSGLRFDPAMAPLIARTGVALCLMHLTGKKPDEMHAPMPDDGQPLERVIAELKTTIDQAVAAGIGRDQIIVDPGLGFGKTPAQNIALVRGVQQMRGELNLPLLIGASRKRFVGAIVDRPVENRRDADTALCALLADRGVDILRVHEVAAAVDAVRCAGVFRS